ncbi:MAG: hypothetical protein EXR75_17175 [Myxococcales bacterium]|nr:hypothetical protein [Myxococcales bacterium]
MARGLIRERAWVLVSALSAALVGCGTPPVICERPATEEPVSYAGGSIEDGVYMSSDWSGELLQFDGGAYYEFHHGLGERPRWWTFYLSFERDGLGSGTLAAAAGNQAEVRALDAETITVVNASCADYWLLAVVGSQSP